MTPSPRISVVLVVGERRERSARALRSVLEQEGIEGAEVVLVDVGSVGVAPLPGAENPKVRQLRIREELSFGEMRARAVKQAQGEVVAFLEDHVEARAGWLHALDKAFDGPWSAVGCEVHNANAGLGFSDTIAWINYGRWSPPMPKGETDLLAGNNSSYRRAALLEYEPMLPDLLMSDTVLQWRMRRDGHRLYADPEVAIDHLNPTTIASAMRAEFLYHWCFGAARAMVLEWPAWKRLAYLVLTPLIPWRRLLGLIRLDQNRNRARSFKDLASAALVLHAAALGQSLGLVIGQETGRMHFTRFEINGARPRIPHTSL